MTSMRSLRLGRAVVLTACLIGWCAGSAGGAGGKVIVRQDAHWKVHAVRGPMRLDGAVLANKAECEKYTITPGNQRSMRNETRCLLQGQNVDWKKTDWRDVALYCPDIIGNPYYPRMVSLVRQEYPPAGWAAADFDDSGWMTVWNTDVRGQEGKGSIYNRALFMRTGFEVPDPAKAKALSLTLSFRGGARVLINGVEIARGHLPKGALAPGVPGASYPGEAYYNKAEESSDRKTVLAIGEIWTRFIKGGRSDDPRLRRYRCPGPRQWNGYKGPWLNREGWNRLKDLRDRELGPITIDPKHLRKGRNVLAVEIRGSRHHPLIFAPGIWGHGKARQWNAGKSWDHARLVSLKLTDPTGLLPSAMDLPKDLRVWAEDMHARLYDRQVIPAVLPTGTLKFVGALNGTFSGMLVLMSGKPVKGLTVNVTDLKGPGGGVIGKDRIAVTGMVGERLTDLAQPGVHIKGLSRDPMNFMSRDALAHVLAGPFLSIPRQRERNWQLQMASNVRFYDHIGSSLPAEVPANVVQPLWVRMKVPPNVPAGAYTGRITVSAEGAKPQTVPVRAEIIPWRVPEPDEFLTDVALEHHPYAIANHYLLPADSQVKPGGRNWLGPVKARVPLWSDEHFRLLAPSLQQMARVGNDLLIVPVLHRTEFGNWEDSMIKWIRRKDGSYDFDYTILDRYLDLAVKHMGRPRVICFAIMHCQLASATPAVTVHDEATGTDEVLNIGWKEDAFKRLPIWQRFGSALLAHMRSKGLAESVYWGHGGDHESDPALMGLFWEVFPNHYWAASGHTYHGGAGGGGHSRNVVRYFADVYGAASPVESMKGWKGAYVGGRPSVALGTQYAASSIGKAERLVANKTYVYVHTPRDELRGAAHPIRWRGIPSVSLHRGYSGLGHIGFDGYDWAYLDGYTGSDWAFPGRPHHMMSWPGPRGAEPSARFEAMLEGIQECEARTFLEQAVDRGLVDKALAGPIEEVLMDYLNHYCLWPQLRSDSVYDFIHDWQGDSRKMFQMAAKVGGIVGVDIDQTNLRTQVAALGQARRALLLRSWTGQARAWQARTDVPWIRLAETRGNLTGFKELEYTLDGKALKPGQTVEGKIYVKDVQSGREQAFSVIADVTWPMELRCDHANFNLRCGKTETRKFRLVNRAAMDLKWTLTAKPTWLKIAPSSGAIPAGSDLFVTVTASPPDRTAATHDNGLILSGANGAVRTAIDSKTFVIPLLREKEGRKMPFGKIIKLDDIGKRWTFHGTCMKGTKIETGAVREVGTAHTQALINPSAGPPCARKEFLPIVGNERFSRAMWVYPHHESVFKLADGRIRAFSAYVGVSNDARQRMIRNQHRKVNFEVWVDGKPATQSGLMKTNSAARYLTVENLEGAKELKLITRLDSNKDDNTFLCCWADVNFYAKPEQRALLKPTTQRAPQTRPGPER